MLVHGGGSCSCRVWSVRRSTRCRGSGRLVDDYLQFVAARARPNTVLAAAYDLKVFFTADPKDPVDVTTVDVFEFIGLTKDSLRAR